MAITGFLDHDGHDLVLTRSVLAPRSLIWDHLTRSDLLATWFGTSPVIRRRAGSWSR
uniref:hypothetical protein n=1 Tax=Brachybacterium alimentarium TaxID=47845 RepID=UPI0015F0516D|nr:hypothetical protein [Brachybacterium alimentarium]